MRPESAHDDGRVRDALRALGASASTRDAITTRRLRVPAALWAERAERVLDSPSDTLSGAWWYAAHSWPNEGPDLGATPRVALLIGDGAPAAEHGPDWPLAQPASLVLGIGTAWRTWRGRADTPSSQACIDLSQASARDWLAWLASLDLAVVVGSDAWQDAVVCGTPVLHLDRDALAPFDATPGRAQQAQTDPRALLADQQSALRARLREAADSPDTVAALNRALQAAGHPVVDGLPADAAVLPPLRGETRAPDGAQRRRSNRARRRRKLAKLRQSPRRFIVDAWRLRAR